MIDSAIIYRRLAHGREGAERICSNGVRDIELLFIMLSSGGNVDTDVKSMREVHPLWFVRKAQLQGI